MTLCFGAAVAVGAALTCLHAAGRLDPYWAATTTEHLSTGSVSRFRQNGSATADRCAPLPPNCLLTAALGTPRRSRRRQRSGLRYRLPSRSPQHRLSHRIASPRLTTIAAGSAPTRTQSQPRPPRPASPSRSSDRSPPPRLRQQQRMPRPRQQPRSGLPDLDRRAAAHKPTTGCSAASHSRTRAPLPQPLPQLRPDSLDPPAESHRVPEPDACATRTPADRSHRPDARVTVHAPGRHAHQCGYFCRSRMQTRSSRSPCDGPRPRTSPTTRRRERRPATAGTRRPWPRVQRPAHLSWGETAAPRPTIPRACPSGP